MKTSGKVTFRATLLGAALLVSAITFAPVAAARSMHEQLNTTVARGSVVTFASGTTMSSTATCPGENQVVTGGSYNLTITTPGNAALNITQTQTSRETWTATMVSGTSGPAGSITAVAVCSSVKNHQRLNPTVARGSVTAFPANTTMSSTATCPREDQVVTGGSYDLTITAPGNLAFNITQTQTSQNTWTATMVSGTNGPAGSITAVAVCSSVKNHQQLNSTVARGLVTAFPANTTRSSTAICPGEDQVVTGGSYDISITLGTSGGISTTETQTSPNKWTTTMVSGPNGPAGSITAVAVCSSLSQSRN